MQTRLTDSHFLDRRLILKAAGAAVAMASAALLAPRRVLAAAWDKNAFAAKTPTDALRAMGVSNPADGRDITVEVAQFAENSAVVPVEITSNIPGTDAISLVIDRNPFPFAARFEFLPGAVPYVRVNVKLGESSKMHILAEAGGRHYITTRDVKVTAGGCGG